MDKDIANALILKLWTVQEQLASIRGVIDDVEQTIADEVENDA